MPFLSVNGKQLFVALVRADEGAEDDKRTTILCIHGLGSAHSFYSSIIPEVTASGYDFVAYDTYGLPSPTAITISDFLTCFQAAASRSSREVNSP